LSFGTRNSYGTSIKKKTKINYRYKKNEYINLGALGIKGKNLVPGDLSIQERKRIKFKENIYEKENFQQEINDDFYLYFEGE
jgi:hypothetical protein